jgi:hypothetical protein
VANATSIQVWNLTMNAGSLQQWTFTLTTLNSSGSRYIPYPITGATWEYSVRESASSGSTLTFSVTTTPSSSGNIAVQTSAGIVTLTVNANISAALAGNYYHALWMNPGLSSAYAWASGNLQIVPTSQP